MVCGRRDCKRPALICFFCQKQRCSSCIGLSSEPLTLLFECSSCFEREIRGSINPAKGMSARFETFVKFAKLAYRDLPSRERRKNTNMEYLRIVRKIARWSLFVGGHHTFPPIPHEATLVAYAYARMDSVNPGTINHDLNAVVAWAREVAEITGQPFVNPKKGPRIQKTMRFITRLGKLNDNTKLACGEDACRSFLAHLDAIEHPSDWNIQCEIALTVGLKTLLRRSVIANRDYVPFAQSASLTAPPEGHVHFFQDTRDASIANFGTPVPSCKLYGTLEKNQKIRAITTRPFSDDSILDVWGKYKPATRLRRALDRLNMKRGPLLRVNPKAHKEGDPGAIPWGNRQWSRFLDEFSKVTGFPRKLLGMTSFRKTMAQALKQKKNLSDEDLQACGYWWSGALKEYSGEEIELRLDILASAKALGQRVPAAISEKPLSFPGSKGRPPGRVEKNRKGELTRSSKLAIVPPHRL